MGQTLYPTDQQGIKQLCAEVLSLAEMYLFRASRGWNLNYSHCRMTTPNFQVSGSIRVDPLGEPLPPTRSKLIVLRFLLRRGRFKPWFLNICHRTATERMDGTGKLSAKKWRRSFAPSLAHPKDHKPSLMRTQVIYVAREMPHEDLWAQLCLYLLQIRVLKEPSKSDLTVQLLSYLKAFRAPPGVDKEDLSQQVFQDLWKNWRWPEDWRAWRFYISKLIKNAARSSRPIQAGIALADVAGAAARSPGSPSLTVENLADRLHVDRSYIYRQIRLGRVRTATNNEDRILVQPEEADRLQRESDRRNELRNEKRAQITGLVGEGMTYAAARKRVYRSREH